MSWYKEEELEANVSLRLRTDLMITMIYTPSLQPAIIFSSPTTAIATTSVPPNSPPKLKYLSSPLDILPQNLRTLGIVCLRFQLQNLIGIFTLRYVVWFLRPLCHLCFVLCFFRPLCRLHHLQRYSHHLRRQ